MTKREIDAIKLGEAMNPIEPKVTSFHLKGWRGIIPGTSISRDFHGDKWSFAWEGYSAPASQASRPPDDEHYFSNPCKAGDGLKRWLHVHKEDPEPELKTGPI